MICPKCGYSSAGRIGRPKHIDDKRVAKLRAKGKTLAEIAKKLGVTRGAIQASLRRGL